MSPVFWNFFNSFGQGTFAECCCGFGAVRPATRHTIIIAAKVQRILQATLDLGQGGERLVDFVGEPFLDHRAKIIHQLFDLTNGECFQNSVRSDKIIKIDAGL